MDTLLLDRAIWDLTTDASGNIAIASDPYAQAQDVASAIRLFDRECWYDTSKGIPYFSEILGHQPPLQLMKARFVAAALTVPGVVRAVCYLTAIQDRAIAGQVQFTTDTGATGAAAVSGAPGPGGVFILGSSGLGGQDQI